MQGHCKIGVILHVVLFSSGGARLFLPLDGTKHGFADDQGVFGMLYYDIPPEYTRLYHSRATKRELVPALVLLCDCRAAGLLRNRQLGNGMLAYVAGYLLYSPTSVHHFLNRIFTWIASCVGHSGDVAG